MERAKFHTCNFSHLPCDTYTCDNRATLNIGGSDAAPFAWTNICMDCAVNLVRSAFEVPELRSALSDQLSVTMQEQTDEIQSLRGQVEQLLTDLSEAESALVLIAAGEADKTEEDKADSISVEDTSDTDVTGKLGSMPTPDPQDDPLKCPKCQFIAKTIHGLASHIRIKHPVEG